MPVTDDFLYRLTNEESFSGLDLLLTFLECIDRPALVLDHGDGLIAWANTASGRVFGYAPAELIGRSARVLHVDQQAFADFVEHARSAAARGERLRSNAWMQRRDGTRFAAAHVVAPSTRVAGRELAVSLVTDVSEPCSRALGARLNRLSPREHDVFQLTITGMTSKEIAERLGVSPRTVEVHRVHLLKKLEVPSTHRLLAEVLTAAAAQVADL